MIKKSKFEITEKVTKHTTREHTHNTQNKNDVELDHLLLLLLLAKKK
jgi:hypothetical protein